MLLYGHSSWTAHPLCSCNTHFPNSGTRTYTQSPNVSQTETCFLQWAINTFPNLIQHKWFKLFGLSIPCPAQHGNNNSFRSYGNQKAKCLVRSFLSSFLFLVWTKAALLAKLGFFFLFKWCKSEHLQSYAPPAARPKSQRQSDSMV